MLLHKIGMLISRVVKHSPFSSKTTNTIISLLIPLQVAIASVCPLSPAIFRHAQEELPAPPGRSKAKEQ